jgi:hypothetical protein
LQETTLKLKVCIAGVLLAASAYGNDDPFPRLGGVNFGGTHNYDDPAYQADLARLNVVLVGTWPGWGASRKTSLEQVIGQIKKLNPQTRIYQYVNSMEVSATDSSVASYYLKMDTTGWWLTQPDGVKVLSEYGAQTQKSIYQINTTLFARRDSDGLHQYEWHARWIVDQYYKKAPSLDGFFEDNVFYQPRVSGDWNLDGTTDTPSTAGKWLREAYRERFGLLHQLMPGRMMLGNIADWGKKAADLTELKGALDGGLIEGLLGSNWSPEKYGGWPELMRHYRKTMDAIAEPKLVLFQMDGVASDYQGLRYGLASCLMDDAYFAFTDVAKGYGGVTWFDEFNVKLGKALSGPALTAWQKGVYRRDFEGGVVLVNPKGNGVQDVTVESGLKHFLGSQAPDVNDGKAVSVVHLLDRDGVVLVRGAKTVPDEGKPTIKPRPVPPRSVQ